MSATDPPQFVVPKSSSVASVQVTSWSAFVAVVETHFLDWSEFIYRGQRDAKWSLRSKFDREFVRATKALKSVDPNDGLDEQDRALVEQADPKRILDSREVVLRRQLERFQRSCVGRRGPAPRNLSDDEWWSLGQHFGLATPLLDWTRSPYVACFFAMQDTEQSKTGNRAVWAFSHIAFREILINMPNNYEVEEGGLLTVELLEPLIDENNRLLSQSGLFTRTPDGADIEGFIQRHADLRGMSPVLYRIDIPESQREAFLRHLEVMNVHAGSLFPDIAGAAEFCNRGLEKESSGVLWKQKPDFIRRMLSNSSYHE